MDPEQGADLIDPISLPAYVDCAADRRTFQQGEETSHCVGVPPLITVVPTAHLPSEWNAIQSNLRPDGRYEKHSEYLTNRKQRSNVAKSIDIVV